MAGQLTIDTLKASSGVLATQNGMTGICKSWVQFAGATGTIAGSFNVSSITRNGTGDSTINFTTALPNANYCVTGACGSTTGAGYVRIADGSTLTTSAVRINSTNYNSSALLDSVYTCVAVFSS